MMKLIGLSGVAGAGKDTFYNIASDVLVENSIPVHRIAFADNLKREISGVIYDKFGIDLFDCTREEKNLVRPILIGWGEARRNMSKGTHWTSLVEKDLYKEGVTFITDVRFKEFDNDEYDWLMNKDGVLVHIKKYQMVDGKRIYTKPFNDSEERNDPELHRRADLKFEWEESDDYFANRELVEMFLIKNRLLRK